MISNSFFSKRRGATVPGVVAVALVSLVLFCGAGTVPVKNFAPQGTMQTDLNAGGHSITNASTLSTTNLVVNGTNFTGGTTGPQGAAGTNGTNGAPGATGPAGIAGSPGVPGPAGTNGTNGTNGLAGATGPMGPSGSTGPTGPAGATGATGVVGAGNGVGYATNTVYGLNASTTNVGVVQLGNAATNAAPGAGSTNYLSATGNGSNLTALHSLAGNTLTTTAGTTNNLTVAVSGRTSFATIDFGSGSSGAFTVNANVATGVQTGDELWVSVAWPTNCTPTLNFYDTAAGATLIEGPNTGTALGGYSKFHFVWSGTWRKFPQGALETRNLGANVQSATKQNLGAAGGLAGVDANGNLPFDAHAINLDLQSICVDGSSIDIGVFTPTPYQQCWPFLFSQMGFAKNHTLSVMTTGSTSGASTSLTVASNVGMRLYEQISGLNIPAGDTIAGFTGSTGVTLAVASTGTVSGNIICNAFYNLSVSGGYIGSATNNFGMYYRYNQTYFAHRPWAGSPMPDQPGVLTGNPGTGTLVINASGTVTGTGTVFTSQLAVNGTLYAGGNLYFVSSIASDTSAVVTSTASGFPVIASGAGFTCGGDGGLRAIYIASMSSAYNDLNGAGLTLAQTIAEADGLTIKAMADGFTVWVATNTINSDATTSKNMDVVNTAIYHGGLNAPAGGIHYNRLIDMADVAPNPADVYNATTNIAGTTYDGIHPTPVTHQAMADKAEATAIADGSFRNVQGSLNVRSKNILGTLSVRDAASFPGGINTPFNLDLPSSTTASATFMGHLLQSALTPGGTNYLIGGVAASTNNSWVLGFNYMNAGSTANAVSLGVYAGTMLYIFPNGHLSTTANTDFGLGLSLGGAIFAADPGTSSALPIFSGTTATTNGGLNISSFLQASLPAGGFNYMAQGVAKSTNNCGGLFFNYIGGGSAANTFGLALYGNASPDLYIDGNHTTTAKGNLIVATVGKGLQVKEGTNAKQGTATLSSGTVTVSNTSVTANSRIQLAGGALNASTALGVLDVPAMTAGTSFIITSYAPGGTTTQTGDQRTVNYEIFEPAP